MSEPLSPAPILLDPYDLVAGVLVPRVRTPLDLDGLRLALDDGHYGATGERASPARLRAACCALGVEHGGVPPGALHAWPGWAVWNFDIGNIDWRELGDSFALTADEVLNHVRAAHTKLLAGHSDAVTGAAAFWELAAAPRFAAGEPRVQVLAAMDAGDLAGVAAALKAGRWYTASEAEYAAGMGAWARVYDARRGAAYR